METATVNNFIKNVKDLYYNEYYMTNCGNKQNQYEFLLLNHFDKINKIVIDGKLLKFCNNDSNRVITLNPISDIKSPDITINNYNISDTWDKTEW